MGLFNIILYVSEGKCVFVLALSVPTVPVKNLNGSSPIHPALAGKTVKHFIKLTIEFDLQNWLHLLFFDSQYIFNQM